MANYDSKNLFQSQNLIWLKRKKKNAVSFLLKAVTFTPYRTAFVPSRKPYRVNSSFTFSDFCARPPATAWKLKGSLGNDDGDGNENGKKDIG